jgi:hypothetical protein
MHLLSEEVCRLYELGRQDGIRRWLEIGLIRGDVAIANRRFRRRTADAEEFVCRLGQYW